MGRNAIETVLGAVVLVVAGLFLVFAYSSADLQKVQGYTVNAYFSKVDGIKEGTDVKINGVKIGSVSGLSLVTNPGANQYKVNVKMTILPHIQLPIDTIAMIASESLLGGKYMALEVGVEEDYIKTDGTGRITRTQPPMRLDDLIGQLIYGSKKSESSSQPQNSTQGQATAPVSSIPVAPADLSIQPASPSVAKPQSTAHKPQVPSGASPENMPAVGTTFPSFPSMNETQSKDHP